MMDLIKPDRHFRNAIAQLYLLDRDFQQIETVAGNLEIRSYEPTFASLVRIIIGQQLSTKAANSIYFRLSESLEILPSNIVACSEEELRTFGLSRSKVACCQSLAIAILEEKINLESFDKLSDDAITSQLLQIKGIGKWTVEIFLLFCLHRLDIFPANDLALQVAYQKLKSLSVRPTAKELITLIAPLAPYRGVVAHLLWHYYRYLQNAISLK
jgi:DNA-3-methyladenine glycosylase II